MGFIEQNNAHEKEAVFVGHAGQARNSGNGQILADVAAGRLRPVVARTFPLEQAAEAHRFIQARSNIGKVVLTVE